MEGFYKVQRVACGPGPLHPSKVQSSLPQREQPFTVDSAQQIPLGRKVALPDLQKHSVSSRAGLDLREEREEREKVRGLIRNGGFNDERFQGWIPTKIALGLSDWLACWQHSSTVLGSHALFPHGAGSHSLFLF
jgi:hypothetical protein